MTETKYGDRIIRVPMERPRYYQAVTAPMMRFFGKAFGPVNFSFNCQYIAQPFLMDEKPHAHDVDQFFFFLGGDLTNMEKFDAEVEIWLGEEAEKHVIGAASIVHIPRGLTHCPINFKRIGSPIFFMDVFLSPGYKRVQARGQTDFPAVKADMIKIDIFNHVMPEKYRAALDKKAGYTVHRQINALFPMLWDIEERFRMMDRFEGLRQVLTVVQPPLETVVDAPTAVGLARLANDEMADLVAKYPDRFIAAAACLPMNDPEAAVKEAERAVRELGFKGVQVFTPVGDKPLDAPEFLPLYEKMSGFDLPIWIHPTREPAVPEYRSEENSRYNLFAGLGWPYETSTAMARLVLSGLFDKLPNIKFIVHHCGAMIPYLITRLCRQERHDWLQRPTRDYFKLFYADTALQGNVPALMCGYAFFGEDHLLFGTDAPFGEGIYDRDIAAVESMEVTPAAKKKIFHRNANRLLNID